MFTGIIEEIGEVRRTAPLDIACRVVVEDMIPGASIAVNGVCLTAVEVRADGFTADVSEETRRRSTLGELRRGSQVNLERPLSPSGRLGGHLVQGHVDGVGEFLSLESGWLRVRLPEDLERYVVEKGSIAIDGISLTVASIEGGVIGAAIVPHTHQSTTLGAHRPGDGVNLECDVLAKYVEKLLAPRRAGLTIEKLRDAGF